MHIMGYVETNPFWRADSTTFPKVKLSQPCFKSYTQTGLIEENQACYLEIYYSPIFVLMC